MIELNTAALEHALDRTLTALLCHRAEQVELRASVPVETKPFAFTRLDQIPTRADSDRQALIRDPVEHALCRAVSDLGRALYEVAQSTDVMRAACERVSAMDSAREGQRLAVIDAWWNGIGNGSDKWWS